MISSVPVLDLFAFDEPIYSSLWKRPRMDEDLEDRYIHMRISEEEDLEHTLRESRRDKEIRRA